ncbi:MAG: SRPBCC family protein [Bacteroidia bacterium]|nr:SRPBCC family protein [Bacteroidia bacterium]
MQPLPDHSSAPALELEFRLQASPDAVFGFLADMQQFAAVHPVISRIEARGGDRYQVYETLQAGFIPVSFSYPATVSADRAARTVVMHATVMRVTHIEMQFEVTGTPGGAIVRERIRFRTPLPIRGLMRRTFRRLHGELFSAIGQAAG